MKKLKTYKFRIYPTVPQVEIMEHTLDTCRFLYNDCLADRKNAYERTGISISYYDQQYELKNREGINIHSKVAQDVLKRLQKAYDKFFIRVKKGEEPRYPRFKGRNRYDSFTYSQSGFKVLNDIKLHLSKIGDIKIKLHRPIEGKIKNVTYAGRSVKQVNPYNTSKTCSNCGHIQSMPLSQRVYKCQECNLILDRDHNEAINILNRVGTDCTELTPVEMFSRTSMNQEAPLL